MPMDPEWSDSYHHHHYMLMTQICFNDNIGRLQDGWSDASFSLALDIGREPIQIRVQLNNFHGRSFRQGREESGWDRGGLLQHNQG